MGAVLQSLSGREFASGLAAACGECGLEPEVVRRLHLHYELLCRWNVRVALIGPGTVDDALERHYAESLTALPLLGAPKRLVDVGSGAGFPGWVLAAARPEIETWLVESSQRKVAFLRTAASKAALPCRVLDARVSALLPAEFPDAVDVVTVRAVRLQRRQWKALESRLASNGRVLRWVGPAADDVPEGWIRGRRIEIAASRRAIEELVRGAPETPEP